MKLISVFREQRQKDGSKAIVVNSFPKDRDYRQEAMQAAAASAVTAMSKYLARITWNPERRCNSCEDLLDVCLSRSVFVCLQSLPCLRRPRHIALSPRRPAAPLEARTCRALPVRPRRPPRTPRLSCRTRLSSGSCSRRSRPRCTSTIPASTWPRSTRVSSSGFLVQQLARLAVYSTVSWGNMRHTQVCVFKNTRVFFFF